MIFNQKSCKKIKENREKKVPNFYTVMFNLFHQAIDDDSNQTGQILSALLDVPQVSFINAFLFFIFEYSKFAVYEVDLIYYLKLEAFNVIREKLRTEAVVRRCSVKKVFLKLSQNLQENTCARVSFVIKCFWPPACNSIKKETGVFL